jgi:hypothetical protein
MKKSSVFVAVVFEAGSGSGAALKKKLRSFRIHVF